MRNYLIASLIGCPAMSPFPLSTPLPRTKVRSTTANDVCVLLQKENALTQTACTFTKRALTYTKSALLQLMT